VKQQEVILPDGQRLLSLNRNETDYLRKEIYEDRVYRDAGTLRLADRPIIFDVGANIGVFSLFAAGQWPGALIHAFEPVPSVFQVLVRNVWAIGRVVPHQLALGAAAGVREIRHYPQHTIMSGFDARPEVDRRLVRAYVENIAQTLPDAHREAVLGHVDDLVDARLVQETVSCRVDTLTAVVARSGIDRLDLLKVDVEGAELDVLRGIDEATWAIVQNAVVEVSSPGDELRTATRWFVERGFDVDAVQLKEYEGTALHMLYASR